MSQNGSFNGEMVIRDGESGDVGVVGVREPLGESDADVRLGGVGAFSGDSDERSKEERD